MTQAHVLPINGTEDIRTKLLPRWETITPDDARRYLEQNTHNRTLRLRIVKAYATDMVEGNWRYTGETIKFSDTGVLLDGQHRLAAVVEAGREVDMLVVRNLPQETQESIDGGVRRTFGDILKLRGEKNYVALAATCRAIASWELGGPGVVKSMQFTTAQLLAVLERNPWLRDATTRIGQIADSGLPVRVGGLVYWLFVQIDKGDTEYFFDRLCSDQNHRAGDPIYELRKAIQNSRDVRGERSARYLLAITIKCWNKYRRGEEVWNVRFRTGGAAPEAFPIPE